MCINVNCFRVFKKTIKSHIYQKRKTNGTGPWYTWTAVLHLRNGYRDNIQLARIQPRNGLVLLKQNHFSEYRPQIHFSDKKIINLLLCQAKATLLIYKRDPDVRDPGKGGGGVRVYSLMFGVFFGGGRMCRPSIKTLTPFSDPKIHVSIPSFRSSI